MRATDALAGASLGVINALLCIDGVVTHRGDEIKCWVGDANERCKTYLSATECRVLANAFAAMATALAGEDPR